MQVSWEWGYERDPLTKTISLPDEQHTVLATFPRPPKRLHKPDPQHWTRDDMLQDEGYLCVILRTLERVELAFSVSRRACWNM